jgi:hypothetical protein
MPAAVAEAKKAEPVTEAPAVEEKPKVANWKKPPLNSDVMVEKLREILGIKDENGEFPEEIYLTIGLYKAMNRHFEADDMGYGALCDMVRYAATSPVRLSRASGKRIILRGTNEEAIYVGQWAFEKHLVNKFGIWLLVDAQQLDLPDSK